MKVSVETKSFVAAVAWVTKSYDSKNTNAYVAMVITKEGKGHLFHASPTSFQKASFAIADLEFSDDEMETGVVELALEGRFIQSLAVTLSKESVLNFTSSESGDGLNVKTKNGRFTIPLLNVPIGSEPEIVALGTVSSRDYFGVTQRIAKLCDPVNAGYIPALGAVDIGLDPKGKKIVMMATDRYALAEVTIPFTPEKAAAAYVEENGRILLPVESASINAGNKEDQDAVLGYDPESSKFGYTLADGRVALFSLKEADPLSYHGIIKQANSTVSNSFNVDVIELRDAIASISNLAWDETRVFFDITEDGLVVADSTRSNKVTVPVVDLEIKQDFQVPFVRAFINEAFSPVTTTSVNFKWPDSKSVFVIEPVNTDGSVDKDIFISVSPST